VLAVHTPITIITGVLYFALVCGVGIAVGIGILALLRFPRDGAASLLLAPSVATMAWALAGNLLARLGLPIRHAAILIWACSAGLAVFGLWRYLRATGWSASERKRWCGLLIGLAAVVVLVSWPHFARGLTSSLGSPNLDTVYYTVAASAYWQFGLDVTAQSPGFFGRFAPFFEYAGSARNHTYVLLALLSPIVQAGEPMYVRNVFVCWSLFVLASGLAFFFMCGRPEIAELNVVTVGRVVSYVLLTIGIGWGVIPTLVGNWDNGLLTAVGPVLAGLLVMSPPAPALPLLLGGTGAYAVYTYPELIPVLAGIVLPFAILRLGAKDRALPTRQLAAYGAAVVLGMALLAPGLPALWRFFWAQVGLSKVSEQTIRPGGPFASGLVEGVSPSAWWALGAEHGGTVPSTLETATAVLLTALALIGAVRLARRPGRGEIWALGVMLASLAWFVFVDPYGYATYKILSVSWWLVGLCLFEGTMATLRASRHLAQYTAAGPAVRIAVPLLVVAVLFVGLVQAERSRSRSLFPGWAFDAQPTPAGLRRLHQAALSQPAADVLITGRLAEPIMLPWILYTLRDTPLNAFHRANGDSLHAPLENPLDATQDVPSVVLTTASAADLGGRARFRTRDFALLDLASEPMVESMDNPNGIEPWGTWLGTKPLVVWLVAAASMPVSLTFDAVPGPSRPDPPSRTVVLYQGDREIGRRTIDGPAQVRFDFKIEAGRTMLRVSCLEQPTIRMLPNGDTRALLIDVRRMRVHALHG
jgi:hypothetical protein